jgi:hypothetical protein
MTVSPPALRDSPADDFLAPEPLSITGVLVGYARVSTAGQLLDRQLHALSDAGCAKVFSDQLSGRDADRPELQACLAYLRAEALDEHGWREAARLGLVCNTHPS